MTTPHTRSPASPSAVPPIALGGAVAAVSSAVAVYQLAGDRELLDWSYTHWAFSYDHGIAKRALVGELVQQVAPPAELYGIVSRLALVLAAVAGAALAALFWQPFFRDRTREMLAFGVVTTTHAATISHLFYDLGRFDVVGLLLALGSIAAILRGRAQTIVALGVAAACATGVLVHEAFVVMYSPLIVACWVWHSPARRPWADPGLLVVVAGHVAALGAVVLAGAPNVAEPVLLAELTDRYGPWIRPESMHVLYGDLRSEASRSLGLLATGRRLVQHAVLAIALLPTIAFVWLVVRGRARDARGLRSAGLGEHLFLAAGAAPLLLYPIGIDFARWWALACTNVLVALAVLLVTSPDWAAAAGGVVRRHPGVVWGIVTVNGIAGPLGVASSPFPWIEPLIAGLLGWLAVLVASG